MACFLSFGCQDLADCSTYKKVAALVTDAVIYPVVTTIVSVVSQIILLIKLIFKSLCYIFSLLSHPLEASISKSFSGLNLETSWSHFVLIPIIGSMISGLIIVTQANKEENLSFLDSCVVFFEAPLYYCSRTISW